MPTYPKDSGYTIRHSQVTLRTVFTVGFGVLVLMGLIWGIAHALVAITLTCAAILLALALDHAAQFLVRRGLRHSLALIVIAVLATGLLVGIGFLLIPPVVVQCREFIHHAPQYLKSIEHSAFFRSLDERLNFSEKLQSPDFDSAKMLTGAAAPLLQAVGGLISFVGAAVTIFFLTIFMLVFGKDLLEGLLRETRIENRQNYRALLHKIYQSVGGYIAGLTLICALNATATITFLAINRVPFFLPLGILSGLSSTIPYAGPFVTGLLISLFSLASGGIWHGFATAIYFLIYGQLEGNVLAPLIFRRAVRVNPLVVTLSILFLGNIAGITGAIVAVPLAATAQIIVRELLSLRDAASPARIQASR